MKKVVYFIPALIFAIFYGLVIIITGLHISPAVYVWIVAFTISGILLSKNIFLGGCFGILPGVHLIYMSTQDTGQILPIEMPIGIMVAVFYILCCVLVFRRTKKATK